MSYFHVRGLRAGYDGKDVLRDVHFELERGCVLGLLGANGSGKSTLLRALCGILPHEGECMLDGQRLDGLNPRRLARLCAYMPQRSGIAADISVLDVVLMGFNPHLALLEQPSPEMRRSAEGALARVGLKGMGGRNYLQLSEGQKQLCILARTLVSRARLLLLDEPEGALDFRHRHRLLELLREWMAEEQACAVVALHDPGIALNHCDYLLLLDGGQALGMLNPAQDAPEDMEQKLEKIYGRISLYRVSTRDGWQRLVMLKERDES